MSLTPLPGGSFLLTTTPQDVGSPGRLYQFLMNLLASLNLFERKVAAILHGAVIGVTDGSDAAVGQVGEYVANSVQVLSAIANGATVQITSVGLTPGDWDVHASIYFQASSSAGTDDLRGGINTVAATMPTGDAGGLAIMSTSSGGLTSSMAVPPMRVSVAAATPVYLNAYASFGAGTMQVKGFIRARRMR